MTIVRVHDGPESYLMFKGELEDIPARVEYDPALNADEIAEFLDHRLIDKLAKRELVIGLVGVHGALLGEMRKERMTERMARGVLLRIAHAGGILGIASL